VTVATVTAIRLETECGDPVCQRFAAPLFEQMSSGRYDVCSVLPIPASVDEWRDAHRTARKRADRAARRHYWAHPIGRHKYADDIYAINTSAAVRQGRPMASGYSVRPSEQPLPVYPCARHAIRTYGVLDERASLVAYLWLYRSGQLALVSQVLGHADHLENEIMYLLFQNVLAYESMIDPDGFVVYNRHDSGTDGLRFFKERIGFEPMEVEWLP
jgi:hypothetical protein